MGVTVIDRCNLVILQEQGYEDLAGFLAINKVIITASLPCYLEDNVDKQRGKGTFNASLSALKKLNALGYGQPDSDLQLNLVFNPQGTNLPPEQQALEKAYKEHLQTHYGLVFNKLFALTNIPIQRFGSMLISKGLFDDYLQRLKDNYRQENLQGVMCRNTLSVDWQGYLYGCDFNQMLQHCHWEQIPMAKVAINRSWFTNNGNKDSVDSIRPNNRDKSHNRHNKGSNQIHSRNNHDNNCCHNLAINRSSWLKSAAAA